METPVRVNVDKATRYQAESITSQHFKKVIIKHANNYKIWLTVLLATMFNCITMSIEMSAKPYCSVLMARVVGYILSV